MAGDTRDVVLPLQLTTHVRTGDSWHFAGERDPFTVKTLNHETGVVSLERDRGGPPFGQWIQKRAGVSRGG